MYQKKFRGWMKHWDFILIDAICLQISFVLSFFTRHGFGLNPYGVLIYFNTAIVVGIVGILFSIFEENHKNILKRGRWQEFRSVLKLVLAVSLGMLVYLFFSQTAEYYSRITILFFLIYALVIVFFVRSIYKLFLAERKKNGYGLTKILLVTTGKSAKENVEKLKLNSFGYLDIEGIVCIDDELEIGSEVSGSRVLSKFDEVIDTIKNIWIDSVLILIPRSQPLPDEFIKKCNEMGVTVHISVGIENKDMMAQRYEKIAGFAVITESIRMASARQLVIKRLMDILGGIVGLIFTGILTIIIGPIIFISDPGNIFFAQERIGKNGRTFKIYKFRSMYKDAEARKAKLLEQNDLDTNLMFKMENDPRIIGSGKDGTKKGIGWFIRRTSIDEFPQFLCVLTGKMSLVGTRPPLKEEWEMYDLHHRARMTTKPGITGLWQVSGRSDITDFEEVVALDLQYINNWNIGLDIKIILQTIKVIFTGSGSK